MYGVQPVLSNTYINDTVFVFFQCFQRLQFIEHILDGAQLMQLPWQVHKWIQQFNTLCFIKHPKSHFKAQYNQSAGMVSSTLCPLMGLSSYKMNKRMNRTYPVSYKQ